ncbi:DinB family protein [Pseudonocardiaceae bacterium YIM PH 21723]|nr:DinB family protein [Pseudonocardiaceae bacterium YIM PH 21723]
MTDAKEDLHRYLRLGRDAMVWKLDGLSEYDIRRPLTPTGTNLLGLLKHNASVGLGYFGETFGRPSDIPLPWYAEDKMNDNLDMFAEEHESKEFILDFWDKAWAHADATIEELPLDAEGQVAWWPPERGPVTLHMILVHVATEVHRHAGHADIVRELIDGTAGLRAEVDNMPTGDRSWWDDYRLRLQAIAEGVR